MLKITRLYPLMALIMIPGSISVAIAGTPTQTTYPTVTSSQANDLVCFMKTTQGSTLNLTQLCGQLPSPASQPDPVAQTPSVQTAQAAQNTASLVATEPTPPLPATPTSGSLKDTGLTPQDYFNLAKSGKMPGRRTNPAAPQQ